MAKPAQGVSFGAPDKSLPVVLTVYPALSEIPGWQGFAANSVTTDCRLWQIVADCKRCTPWIAARLLAAHLVDAAMEHAPLFWPSMMPPRPAAAYLTEGEPIRQGRGRAVPQWAETEINRVAAVLLRDHGGYISALHSACIGNQPPGYRKTTPDFWIYDAHGYMLIAPPPPQPSVDISASPEANGVRGYDLVAEEYRRLPYMQQLSREKINQRATDIMANVHVLDDEGRISADPDSAVSLYWLSRLGEVAVEMQARYGPYPAGWEKGMIKPGDLPASLNPNGRRIAGRLETARPIQRRYVVKYGERQFLEPMLNKGLVRILPAANYADPSLNSAIRDDELSLPLNVDQFTAGPLRDVFHLGPTQRAATGSRLDVTIHGKSNYYVFCAAYRLSARLIMDFGGDACLVIHNPDEFADRINQAMRPHTEGWSFVYRDVEYYDPLQTNLIEVNVLYSKHFRYSYQRETRLAWLPPAPVVSLDPVYLELGPLTDIAELVIPTAVQW